MTDHQEQAERLAAALEFLLESSQLPPERNCSCHISPPCDDCVTFSAWREAVTFGQAALDAHNAFKIK